MSYKKDDGDTVEDAIMGSRDGKEDEEVYQRARCFTCMDIFCKSACVSFICAWVLFVIVFGTGKLFTWVKTTDAAVSWT